MSKSMFECLMNDLGAHRNYWIQRIGCCGQVGLSPHQKLTSTICQLAYGLPADATDEYLPIGESTALETLKKFVNDVVNIYEKEYLRAPTDDELKVITKEYEDCGFPGCHGSIDGMHWEWKNFPQAWAGQYQGKEGVPTMVLEAVASLNLCIWNCFFGSPGTHNDINVVQNSHIFDNFLDFMF